MSEKYVWKYLMDEVLSYLTPDVKKLQTNGNIASYLQDSNEFIPNIDKVSLYTHLNLYKLGTLKNTDIYVDPFMRWDDNRILFFDNKDKILHTMNIDFDSLTEQSTNEERSNKLKMILDDDSEETNKFNEEQIRLEKLKRLANLDKIFRSFVFNLLEVHPKIKKIKTSTDICSKLKLFEYDTDYKNPKSMSVISFKLGLFEGKAIAEYDKKIINAKLTLYSDSQQSTDEILFLDENNNEIFKTNLSLI